MATGHRGRRRCSHLAGLALCSALVLLSSACQSSSGGATAEPGGASPSPPPKPSITITPAQKTSGIKPDGTVKVSVQQGHLDDVTVAPQGSTDTASATPSSASDASSSTEGAVEGAVKGDMGPDATTWSSTGRLDLATTYTVTAKASGEGRTTATSTSTFRTLEPKSTFTTPVAPLEGETVGVGMPIAVYFSEPIKNKANVEKRLKVESSTPVDGSWYWVSDKEAHYRPQHYWPANDDITVKIPLAGVDAGNGVWGEKNRVISFHTGDAIISHVYVKKHRMTVSRNGHILRSIPVTTGKPGFATRSGTKVVLSKTRHKHMDASTIGISKNSPDYYDLKNVEYAVRVTWSGEFIHAAPWSVGDQGSDNVSHGCVGMTTADAKWYFNLTKRGDIVQVTGSPRHMELTNGFGDWTLSWSQWQQGSALH